MRDYPPTKAQIAEPDDHNLPCDVWIGHVTFRKGVSLGTLAAAARRWFEIAKMGAPGDATERAHKIVTKFCKRPGCNFATDIAAALTAAEDGARRAHRPLIDAARRVKDAAEHTAYRDAAQLRINALPLWDDFVAALATKATPGEGGTTDA